MTPRIRADVILVAHGAAGDASPATRNVIAIARRAAATLRGAHVSVAFLGGSPSVAEAVAHSSAPRCAIVPLLADEGMLHDRIRDEAIRAMAERSETVRLTCLRPIGNHRRVRTALAHQVARVIGARGWQPARVTVVLLASGTSRAATNAAAVRAAARAISSRTRARATIAFLDQRATIEAVATPDAERHLVIVPFLFGVGSHESDDPFAQARAVLTLAGTREEGVAWIEPLGEQRWLSSVVRDVIQHFLRPLTRVPHLPSTSFHE